MDTEKTNLIIDRLGGTTATARLCEVEPPSVSDWRKVGIPKARLQFLRLARPDVFAEIEGDPAPHNRRRDDPKEGEERRESQGGTRQPIDPTREMT